MEAASDTRTRTITWEDPVADAANHRDLTGFEVIEGIHAGRFQGSTMDLLIGCQITTVEPGHVTVQGEPSELHYNPLGTVHGAFYATLLDSVMGYSVISLRGAAEGFATVEMSFKLVRALSRDTGTVTATGTVPHLGRKVAIAEAELRDSDGRLCATASSTCMLLERR